VTEGVFTTVGVWSYGLALAAYTIFSARVAIGSRRSPRARLLLLALVTTALWGALSLPLAFAQTRVGAILVSTADALRYGAWLAFLWHLLRRPDSASTRLTRGTLNAFIAVGAVLLLSVLLGEGFYVPVTPGMAGQRTGFFLDLAIAVFGLTLIEQLVRRAPSTMRWSIKPLAVGLAGVFGLDLLLYADAALFGVLDADIWASRGFANVIVIPFLAIATARNTGWTVDLHLSRGAVFHSSALLVSGGFLLLVAGAGYFVRYFGGLWGRALQIELLFAATLAIVLVASSRRYRAKLKVFLSKHFFSYRYDYREEWLRFTRTLSSESSLHGVQERAITALADLVESPGGALWLRHGSVGYVPAARWNVPVTDAIEPLDGTLAAFLDRTGWVVDVPEARATPARYDGLALPAWIESVPSAWLIVPLATGPDLIGFVVLTAPRAAISVDWEVRDVLKTASRQAASYLGHMRAAEALLEARKFDAFNRMSAFVVHDLKNLVAQLSLMVRNAERHRDNPQFQSDMLETVQHVVGRMNALMLQLRSGAEPVENALAIDMDLIVRRVCSAKSASRVRIALESSPGAMVLGHEQRLERVIGHLVQNAIDASPPDRSVTVRVESAGRFIGIVVGDEGPGMTPEFIRDRLFKPFETTKQAGMGIGVYESAQYVNGLGGEIHIDSRPGQGTRVSVRIPCAEVPARPGVVDEQVT
jgi:putative PEP-CTERM system histidine kinase